MSLSNLLHLNISPSVNGSNPFFYLPGWNVTLNEAWLLHITIMRSIYITIGVIGMAGNLLCLVVLLFHAPLRRKQANYFLISQSVIDLLASVLLTLVNVVIIVPDESILGVLTCYLWTTRSVFLGLFLASLFNITFLTVERYAKTVHPIRHRNWATKNRLICVIVVVAIVGVLAKMPYSIGGTSMQQGICMIQVYPSEAISVVVTVYNFLVEYFGPLAVIAFCYAQMARSLRGKTPASGGPGAGLARARKSILKTLWIVVLLFVACTTFKQALLLGKVISRTPIDYGGVPFNVAQVLSFLVCCTNPFVYLAHYEEFQKGLRAIVCRRPNTVHPKMGEHTLQTERTSM